MREFIKTHSLQVYAEKSWTYLMDKEAKKKNRLIFYKGGESAVVK